METFDKDNDYIEKWKVVPEAPPDLDMPVRKALQFIGDGFRQIKASIWMDLVFRDSDPDTYGVVSDARYINELARVKQEGGFTVLVVRPDQLNDDPNPSEAQIKPLILWAMKNSLSGRLTNQDIGQPDGFKYVDYVLNNNGSVEDLYAEIDGSLTTAVSIFLNLT
jgi:hypothetical protein